MRFAITLASTKNSIQLCLNSDSVHSSSKSSTCVRYWWKPVAICGSYLASWYYYMTPVNIKSRASWSQLRCLTHTAGLRPYVLTSFNIAQKEMIMSTDTRLHGSIWGDRIRYVLYLPYLGIASKTENALKIVCNPTVFLSFIEVSKWGRVQQWPGHRAAS